MGERKEWIKALISELGEKKVITEEFRRAAYTTGFEGHLVDLGIADVILLPETTEEVQKIVQIANRYEGGIPLVAIGGHTFWQGSNWRQGGIKIDTTMMNKIIDIDEDNMVITCQAGASVKVIDDTLRKMGYFYPCHPYNPGRNTIGTDVVKDTMGAYGCASYAPLSHYVIGIKVVFGNGDIVQMGSTSIIKGLKPHQRYGMPDMYGLIAGSEGGFGVVTEVQMKFLQLPEALRFVDLEFPMSQEGMENMMKCLHELVVRRRLLAPTCWWFDNYSKSFFYRSFEYSSRGEVKPVTEPFPTGGFGKYHPDQYGLTACFSISSWVSDQEAELKEKCCIEIAEKYGGKFAGRDFATAFENPETMWNLYCQGEAPMRLSLFFGSFSEVSYKKMPTIYKRHMEEFMKVKDIIPLEGLTYYSNLTPTGQAASVLFRFHPEDKKAAAEALELRKRLDRITAEEGCLPYKLSRTWVPWFLDYIDPAYLKYMHKLKDLLDPNNIMNPDIGVFCRKKGGRET